MVPKQSGAGQFSEVLTRIRVLAGTFEAMSFRSNAVAFEGGCWTLCTQSIPPRTCRHPSTLAWLKIASCENRRHQTFDRRETG